MRVLQIALLLSGSFANAQTRLAPAQVKAWPQVAQPASPASGTKLRLEQLAIDPGFVAIWTETIRLRSYDHYRIALDPGQPNPVLIVCARPEDNPLGPGCAGGLFWFALLPVRW